MVRVLDTLKERGATFVRCAKHGDFYKLKCGALYMLAMSGDQTAANNSIKSINRLERLDHV